MIDKEFYPGEEEYRPTLRDQFAMAYISGANPSGNGTDYMVRQSYAWADSMMIERKKKVIPKRIEIAAFDKGQYVSKAFSFTTKEEATEYTIARDCIAFRGEIVFHDKDGSLGTAGLFWVREVEFDSYYRKVEE